MTKPELLAPAGDLEKLKVALHYGADAVYIGGEIFGLRASAKNFSLDEMAEGVAYAHELGRKVYLVLNIIPHNEDIEALESYIDEIQDIPFDAVILSDPGTLLYVKEKAPHLTLHLSTQANNTNYKSAEFWHKQGIERVILAREMSLTEIWEIRDKTPESLELEAFIHGAMCIAYSGRCLLSNYMAGRDANKGACAHPCRWEYALVEKQRPGEAYEVVEDDKGTYFFNSKDLCMINHVKELMESGLDSLKIEGRMKSLYYVAAVVRVYREALDTYFADPDAFETKPNWLAEIAKVSHRKFTTGFYFKRPDEEDQHYDTSSYIRDYDFLGVVKAYDAERGVATIEQRNRFFVGDTVEVIGPDYRGFEQVVTALYDDKGTAIESVPHPQMIFEMAMDQPVAPMDLLRMKRED